MEICVPDCYHKLASHAEIKYCLIYAWFWGFTLDILYFSSKYFFSLYKQYIGSYKLYIIFLGFGIQTSEIAKSEWQRSCWA